MIDTRIRQDILDELEFDPSIEARNIGVAVNTGVATLSGYFGSYAEKLAALTATKRVKGVKAVADEIEVRYHDTKKTADDQIAKRIVDILGWDIQVPGDSIQAVVHDGWVTLTGSVEWQYQRRGAEDDVRKLSGVRGVNNLVELKPRVHAADVKRKIEDALKRHADTEAKAIEVRVEDGCKVVLEGKVDNWDERQAVENAAWSAPGVRSVIDHITIT